MRKAILLILALLLCLCCFGCAKTENAALTEPTPTAVPEALPISASGTEPETTQPATEAVPISLFGIDMTGMSAEQAYQTLLDTVSCYQLTLRAEEKELTFSAQDLQLDVSQDAFESWFAGQGNSNAILTFRLDQAIYKVEQQFSSRPRNAGITYNDKIGRFVSVADRTGTQVTDSTAEGAIREAVSQLQPTVSATVTVSSVAPTIRSNDTRLAAALDAANLYLDISLSYIFEAPGVEKATETLSKATLASFVHLDSNFNVSIDTAAVKTYVNGLCSKYGGERTKEKFITTYGNTINRTVEYYGASVDLNALYQDLTLCLAGFVSGTRIAPYTTTENPDMPYGGNYVEIDLSSQMLWVYKNGYQAVATPIVSGDVTSGAWTGVGLFSVQDRDTNCWLVGSTFRDFVYYWIGFNGNIGIHDATWRDEFGGSIYKYNGSHGCINLPLNAARQVYDHVSVGTKVIVYGGSSYVAPMTQSFTGTDRYSLTTQSAPFYLNVTPTYRATQITYASADPNVVTVDERGVVTVVGPGSTTVTVTSEKIGPLSSATFTVTITVEAPATEPATEPVTEPVTDPTSEPATETPSATTEELLQPAL